MRLSFLPNLFSSLSGVIKIGLFCDECQRCGKCLNSSHNKLFTGRDQEYENALHLPNPQRFLHQPGKLARRLRHVLDQAYT
jgi:hypothetical protein